MLIWDWPTVLQSWIFLHFVFIQFKKLSFLQILLFLQGVCVGFVFSALMEYALVNYALRAKGARKRKLSEVLEMIKLFFHHVAKLFACRWVFFFTFPHDFFSTKMKNVLMLS